MKKITALIVSLVMTCAVMAGCGSDSDSSSAKADKSSSAASADESKAASADESKTASDDESKTAVADKLEDTLAAKYTESLQGGSFSADMTYISGYSDDAPMLIEVSGSNIHISMTTMGMTIEYYIIDGKMYTLDESTKTYYTMDMGSEDMASSEEMCYGITDDYTFVSSEKTDDGMICETFSYTESWDLESGVTLESGDSAEAFSYSMKYYFDESTGSIVKIEIDSMGSVETVEFNSFTTENVEVKLPDDFDTWTEESFDLEGWEYDESDTDFELDAEETGEAE